MDLIKHMDLSSAGQTVLLLVMYRSRQTKGSILKERRGMDAGFQDEGKEDMALRSGTWVQTEGQVTGFSKGGSGGSRQNCLL